MEASQKLEGLQIENIRSSAPNYGGWQSASNVSKSRVDVSNAIATVMEASVVTSRQSDSCEPSRTHYVLFYQHHCYYEIAPSADSIHTAIMSALSTLNQVFGLGKFADNR